MSVLLARPEAFTDRIESFSYEYLSFQSRKLSAGAEYAAETDRQLALAQDQKGPADLKALLHSGAVWTVD